MRTPKNLIVAVVAAVALLTAACGTDDDVETVASESTVDGEGSTSTSTSTSTTTTAPGPAPTSTSTSGTDSEDDTTTSATPATTTSTSATSTSTTEPTTEPGDGAITADQLTVDHGCGFGFAKGSEAQDAALIIFFTGAYTPEGPDVSTPIVWPNDEWTGEAQTGSDLFSNWCNDAIGADDPVPVVARSWTLVEGTLTVETVERAVDVADVSATLTGAVFESADGERLVLDTVSLRNELWGFFAG